MIEAICDKCGKKTTLRYFRQGFENPPGWQIETQDLPTRVDLAYVTLCPDCNPHIVRKEEEE